MIIGPLEVWRACWRYLGAGLSRNNARTRDALITECLALRLENAALRAKRPCDVCRQRIAWMRWECETCTPNPNLKDYPGTC